MNSLEAAFDNLPPFPPVASQVITLTSSELVSFQEVADVLKSDAALTAEVLRLANSPLVAPTRYAVSSVLPALNLIGLKRLVGLVMTLSLSKFLKRAGTSPLIRRSWRHNLACGLAARETAEAFREEPDEAYNAGLFHDLGRIAFLVMDAHRYESLVATEGDIRELERDRFGIDHCQAGALILANWRLPKVFADVARYHHEPTPDCGLSGIVNSSCAVANRLGFSVRPPDPLVQPLEHEVELGAEICRIIDTLEVEYGV